MLALSEIHLCVCESVCTLILDWEKVPDYWNRQEQKSPSSSSSLFWEDYKAGKASLSWKKGVEPFGGLSDLKAICFILSPIDEHFLRFMGKCKTPRIAKTRLKNKDTFVELSLSNFKTYCKATIVKTLWCWDKDLCRSMEEIVNVEINLYIYSPLIFLWRCQGNSLEKVSQFNKWNCDSGISTYATVLSWNIIKNKLWWLQTLKTIDGSLKGDDLSKVQQFPWFNCRFLFCN